jgi:hypothetical protein
MHEEVVNRAGRAQLLGVLAEEIAPEGYGTNIKLLARRGLIGRHRPIEGVATFATIKIGVLAKLLPRRFLFIAVGETCGVVIVPTLQVPHAQLAFRVFFVTRALSGLLILNLQSLDAHHPTLGDLSIP